MCGGHQAPLSVASQPLAAERQLMHLPLALEAARGSAPRKVAPCLALAAWPSLQVRLSQGGRVIQARGPDPGPLMDQPGQLFMDSSCCFSEAQAPELPTAGCSVGWLLNCG